MQIGADAVAAEFGRRLAELGWVTALHVGGSLATGDHSPGISDLDLVAVTASPLTHQQRARVVAIHATVPDEAKLGCCYVPAGLIDVLDREHPTWTHGQLIQRRLSGLARAELVRHGYAVFGREPTDVWGDMTTEEVRRAVADELTGYWTWACRRPWVWLSVDQIDLAVTTMLRARHTLATGELITKSAALAQPAAGAFPRRLVATVRARRTGARDHKAHLPRDAVAAWRLTRRTIADARASA